MPWVPDHVWKKVQGQLGKQGIKHVSFQKRSAPTPKMGRVGTSAGSGEVVLGDFVGTIRSFVRIKNYGFIECEKLAEYGDVFLWGDEKKDYQEGHKVRFTAVLTPEGKPTARNLRSGLKKTPSSTSVIKKSTSFIKNKPEKVLGEFTGTIKSFVMIKNYGFIECDELAEYGDVFLWGDEKKGYREGHTVRFTAVLNKEGKPVAKDLKSGLKTQNSSKGGRNGAGTLGEFTGTIKSFVNKSGYGFIECDDLAHHGDVFLWESDKKNYRVGHVVKFTAVMKDGKPAAKNLKSGLK